jgi:hypothetical protein
MACSSAPGGGGALVPCGTVPSQLDRGQTGESIPTIAPLALPFTPSPPLFELVAGASTAPALF